MWTLISATPSPYARKVRIALQEKGLPFTLQTEVPWDSTTKTPSYNPLEKLPVLILDDGETAIYESHYIMEWLETKYPETSLMPEGLEEKLFAKKVEVVCDGICDALVLVFFEGRREVQSEEWRER
jgi:glutathione S-transferase